MKNQTIVVGAGGVGAEVLKRLSGQVRVIDRDFVDEDTLKRQTLYSESDLGKLKARIAEEKLGFEGICEHLNEDNADDLLKGDVVLDCTDNWQTRCVINSWALKHQKPWIFTSAIRNETMITTLTQKTPCFVCWNPQPKKPRSCRTEGILKETTAIAAETQVAELEALLEGKPKLEGKLQYTDVLQKVCAIKTLKKNVRCPACVEKTFTLPKATAVVLCGDNEFLFDLKQKIDFRALVSLKPRKFGDVLKIKWKKGELIVFKSGRLLTQGLSEKRACQAANTLKQKLES